MIPLENRILQFAKYMSLCFAVVALFCLVDLYLQPVSEIQYVLAHESESGYRNQSGSKYGASYFRDNYLHTIKFCANKPYRLRPNEIDTLLVYESVDKRTEQANQLQHNLNSDGNELKVEKLPVDLKTYYKLEDGDSIQLFFSPWRHKLVEYVTYETEGWDKLSFERLQRYQLDHQSLNQWNLTTQVFCFIVFALTAMTWLIKPFEYSVGIFVFNVVITTLLNWIY